MREANLLDGSEIVQLSQRQIHPSGLVPVLVETAVRNIANLGETIVQVSTIARTLATTDIGKYLQFTSNSSITLTISANADVAFRIGDVVTIEQNGSGVVTFASAGGVTINSNGDKVATNGQFAVVSIKKVDTNVWTLFGNLA